MPLYTQRQFIILLSLLLPMPANAGWCARNKLNCHDLPNGNIEMYVHGEHCYYIIAKKDRANPKAKPIKSTCPWDRK